MAHFDPIIETKDDGLFIPDVGEWSIEKYKLVGGYCEIFSTGMKDKWNQLVYIDLFAGAGYSRIKGTGKVLYSSSLIALSVPYPFTKYILCEKDPERFAALEDRVRRDFPNRNVALICGDSNENIDQVIEAIPRFRRGNTLLPFCFVDPFSLNLKFSTIKALGGNSLMDFLILQALHMDANRNFAVYLEEENEKIADYLGMPDWRERFKEKGLPTRKDFVRFLAEQYEKQMASINYKTAGKRHQIRSRAKNLPLYYLAFYSKHPRGNEFFDNVNHYLNPQGKLF